MDELLYRATEKVCKKSVNCGKIAITQDRNTYNLVQQELARRSSKRKKSDKAITEQGKYSSKFALTEIMVCAECGSAYKRVIWNIHGRKCAVWRCIS